MAKLVRKAKRGTNKVLSDSEILLSFSDVRRDVVGVYLSGEHDYILELGVEDAEGLIDTLQNRIAGLKKYKE